MERDLTRGSIKRHYFKYLGAAFGSAMISCIYGMVDAAVVGQYQGPQGAAALSVIMPIWTILYSLGLLTGIGGSVSYAFYKAQEKREKANACFTLSLVLTGLISLLCWVGITVFEDQLLRLFGADDALLLLAKVYLRPVKLVIPAYPFSQLLAAFLRNDNSPGKATVATLLGGVFNMVGDVFFVFVLDMGMAGAGLATALGAALSVLVMLTHFFTRGNTLRLGKISSPMKQIRLLLLRGFSPFVADLAMGVVAMLFNRQIMRYFGSDALAVFGVIVQVTGVVQCATYGVGQAAQPILSANYSLGLTDRVRQTMKYALWTVGIFGLLWMALMLAVPNTFVGIFMSPTERVLELAPGIMRIYGLSYLLLPLNILATYYFPSVNRPRPALAVSLARGVVLSGLLVYVLPALLGSGAVWWVMPLTELLVALYALWEMARQKNKPV